MIPWEFQRNCSSVELQKKEKELVIDKTNKKQQPNYDLINNNLQHSFHSTKHNIRGDSTKLHGLVTLRFQQAIRMSILYSESYYKKH